jgi:uncharacterized protein YxjI
LLFCSCSSTQNLKRTQTITIDGSKSYDLDGKIVKYEWKVTNGSVTNANAVKTTATVNKNSTIELVVTDDKGATGTQIKSMQ